MKKFRVGFYYQEIGYTDIEAKSKKDAESKVLKVLEQDGIDNIEIDCTDRDYGITDSEEVIDD